MHEEGHGPHNAGVAGSSPAPAITQEAGQVTAALRDTSSRRAAVGVSHEVAVERAVEYGLVMGGVR